MESTGASVAGMDDMIFVVGSDLIPDEEQPAKTSLNENAQDDINETGNKKGPTLATEEAQQDALKKIGNVARYPLDRDSLIDHATPDRP